MAEGDNTVTSAREHHERASALLDAGRLVEAERECRRSLQLAPDSATTANLLAIVLDRSGRGIEATELFGAILARQPDFVPALHNLGLALRSQHRHVEALACFEKLLAADPGSRMARNYVGATLVELGRIDEAIVALEEAARHDPANGSLTHMLAALKGVNVDAPPVDFVRKLFDEYADSFEDHLVAALAYDIPALLRRMVGGLGPRRFARALDLGCGTGLVGVAFADLVDAIIGVDVAPNMVREARKKNLYNSLHAQTFDEYFATLPAVAAPFDLVLAADVFIYVGKLDRLFEHISAHMARGGLFGFSIEHLTAGDFTLQQTGRYSHSAAYVERLAQIHGFAVAAREAAVIRTGYPGSVLVLKRV